MIWLVEQPLPILLIGLLSLAILTGGLLRTGHPGVLYAMIGVGVLTVLLLLIEYLVVTQREQVEATLHALAAEVEQNDLEGVLAHIHSQGSNVRRQASAELPRYDFEQVKIKRNLAIEVNVDHQPPKAEASFNVVVIGSGRDRFIGRRHVPRFVRVTFYKEDGRWRVHSYSHHDPREGL